MKWRRSKTLWNICMFMIFPAFLLPFQAQQWRRFRSVTSTTMTQTNAKTVLPDQILTQPILNFTNIQNGHIQHHCVHCYLHQVLHLKIQPLVLLRQLNSLRFGLAVTTCHQLCNKQWFHGRPCNSAEYIYSSMLVVDQLYYCTRSSASVQQQTRAPMK